MTTSVPILHTNKSEELTKSFTPSVDEENVEEDLPIINLHILSVGSIVCASLFFIIVASYVGYVHWRINRIQSVRKRAPRRQLPTIPGVTGSPYEEPRSVPEPSRRLHLVPPELEDTKVYSSTLRNGNVSLESHDTILERHDGMTDSTGYLIPRNYISPLPSEAVITRLPSQRYKVKDCKTLEQYVPMSPIRIFDPWPDDCPPPIPSKVEVFV